MVLPPRVADVSALHPKADIVHGGGNVRFVPKADIGTPYSITSLATCEAELGNAGNNSKRPLNACCETLKIDWI
jgi:hypothetical protein